MPFHRKPRLLTAPETAIVQVPAETSLTIDTKLDPPIGTQPTVEAVPTLQLAVPDPAPVVEPITPPLVPALSTHELPSMPANILRPMMQAPMRPDGWLLSRARYFAAGRYSTSAHSDLILAPDLLFGLELQSNRGMKYAPEHTPTKQLPPSP